MLTVISTWERKIQYKYKVGKRPWHYSLFLSLSSFSLLLLSFPTYVLFLFCCLPLTSPVLLYLQYFSFPLIHCPPSILLLFTFPLIFFFLSFTLSSPLHFFNLLPPQIPILLSFISASFFHSPPSLPSHSRLLWQWKIASWIQFVLTAPTGFRYMTQWDYKHSEGFQFVCVCVCVMECLNMPWRIKALCFSFTWPVLTAWHIIFNLCINKTATSGAEKWNQCGNSVHRMATWGSKSNSIQ